MQSYHALPDNHHNSTAPAPPLHHIEEGVKYLSVLIPAVTHLTSALRHPSQISNAVESPASFISVLYAAGCKYQLPVKNIISNNFIRKYDKIMQIQFEVSEVLLRAWPKNNEITMKEHFCYAFITKGICNLIAN
jgi:hypothetical protein